MGPAGDKFREAGRRKRWEGPERSRPKGLRSGVPPGPGPRRAPRKGIPDRVGDDEKGRPGTRFCGKFDVFSAE